MTQAVMTLAVLRAAETQVDSPVPPIGWGLGVLGTFLVLLIITLVFGKGRPHA